MLAPARGMWTAPWLPADVWELIASHGFAAARQLRLVARFNLRAAAVLAIQRGWRRASLTVRWQYPVGGVNGSHSLEGLVWVFGRRTRLTSNHRAVYADAPHHRGYFAAQACSTLQPPPTPGSPLTFLVMLVLDRENRASRHSSLPAAQFQIAAFEPGHKGHDSLPFHSLSNFDFDAETGDPLPAEYESGTRQQLFLDEPLGQAACVTTDMECFDTLLWPPDRVAPIVNTIRTCLRFEVRAAGDSRVPWKAGSTLDRAPVVSVSCQLEDKLVACVDLLEASPQARYRLIASFAGKGYARLLSPAQAARIFPVTALQLETSRSTVHDSTGSTPEPLGSTVP